MIVLLLLLAQTPGEARVPVTPPAIETATIAKIEEAPKPIHHSPRVLIIPTVSTPPIPGRDPIEQASVDAFSGELNDAAGSLFDWRRWQVVDGEEAERAIVDWGPPDRCVNALCFDTVAQKIGATHWLSSVLIQTNEGNCRARVFLHNLVLSQYTRNLHELMRPCSADNLLSKAATLGRDVAEGPRAPVQVTVALTPLELNAIDIPDIPDVERYHVDTATTTLYGYDLEQYLEMYRNKHMYIVQDNESASGFYVVRGDEILSECGVLRAASVTVPRNILEFCEGNDWEWFWLGVPAGGLIALGSYGDLDSKRSANVLGFTFGTAIAAVSMGLALILNVDAKDPEDGLYYSSQEDLQDLISKSNIELRNILKLTEAEIEVAGMRR